MSTHLTGRLLPLAAVFSALPAQAQHSLSLEADAPTVEIAKIKASGANAPENNATSSRTLRLPELTYALTIQAHCNKPFLPESLTVTAADSHLMLNADQILATHPLEIALSIPADQIGPLTTPGICRTADSRLDKLSEQTASNPAAAPEESAVTVAGVLSAYASLRCSDGIEEQMIASSLPLDVTLSCESSAAETASTATTENRP